MTHPSPLRPAGLADARRIVDLMAAFNAEMGLPFDPARGERLVRELLASPALGRLWLIEAGGCAVG